MKSFKLVLLLTAVAVAAVSCSSKNEAAQADRDYDGTLYGEWVESGSGNRYIFDYYCFYSDGTGIHGSYEPDIDVVNEDDDFEWYTVDDEYLYIDGNKYEYWCDGSSLDIVIKGRTRSYYAKD